VDKSKFISYLESKDFAIKTIKTHVQYVEQFFAKTKKEDIEITKPDVLKYLEYLKNTRKLQNVHRSYYLVSLNHYFTFLCQEETVAKNPCSLLKIRGTSKKKLHKIYTPGELEQLFDNYYHFFVRNCAEIRYTNERQRQYTALSRERNAIMLNTLVHQGATTGEIEKIELDDLNLIKATIKIRSARKNIDRKIPLKASQIGLLMHYLQNIRPQLLEYGATESNKLFLLLPCINKKKKDSISDAFYRISKQLKTIDKQYVNVLQIRTSVITFWIKTQGLRKAQYLAGHCKIHTTENYLPNNLDDLIDDINKLHPFL